MADAQHIHAVTTAVLRGTEPHEWSAHDILILANVLGAVFDSSDPAVHAAMLDALVRAGVLREYEARVILRRRLTDEAQP